MRAPTHRARQVVMAAAAALAATLTMPVAAFAADDAPQLAGCEDLLVTISPTGTAGDDRAAAVTAQALVADVDGWESVAWTTASGTELREVLVLHADGSTRSVGAQREGTASAVLELGFCGTRGETPPMTPETGAGDEATVEIEPQAPAPTNVGSETTSADGARASATDDTADEAAGEAAPDPDERAVTRPDDTNEGAESASDGASGDTPDDKHPAERARDADDSVVFSTTPLSPTTAGYLDTVERQARPFERGAATATHVQQPSVTLLAAPAAGSSGSSSQPSTPASPAHQGPGGALAGLLGGLALAGTLLVSRRRFAPEVPA